MSVTHLDLLQFVSSEEIDKVVQTGTASFVVPGPSGSSYAGSEKVAQQNDINNYKKKCLVRYRWRIDGGDWNSPDTYLTYGFTVDATAWGGPVSDPQPGTLAATVIGCDPNFIKLRGYNGHHSNVTYTGTGISPGPDSYTGYPHTFEFQYALLEIE